MNEQFIEKPEGKPVKNFRARVKMYGNDVVVVNINVDANDPDPVATMQEQFAELTKGELKSELKLKVKGKLLYDSPKLKVYLNKTQKQVILQTTLDCGPTVERELLQIQADMAKVIGANYSEIIKVKP
jgi:hypothetical protein